MDRRSIDMKNNKKQTKDYDVTAEALKERICKYDRNGVLYQLKKGALDRLPGEDRISVIQQILMLRDMRLVDILAKQLDFFTADMFEIDLNNRLNHDFVDEILDKHTKKFDFSDEQVCDQIFTLARTVGNAKLCSILMKKTTPSDDAIVEALFHAATERDAKGQILALDASGYDIQTENSADETVAVLLKRRITKYTYPSGKKGIQMRRADLNTLQFLEELVQARMHAKKSRKHFLIGSVAGVAVIALLSFGTIFLSQL